MSKFRSSIAPWALPLVGLWLVINGIITVLGLSVGLVVIVLLGLLAIVAGIACLLAS